LNKCKNSQNKLAKEIDVCCWNEKRCVHLPNKFDKKYFFMATRNSKQVKLHGRSRPCQSSISGNKDVPWLNVSGVWLEELGFKVGDTVSITTREKLLIIELLEGEAKEQEEYKTAPDFVIATPKNHLQIALQ
jgi:toxic protein SymE